MSTSKVNIQIVRDEDVRLTPTQKGVLDQVSTWLNDADVYGEYIQVADFTEIRLSQSGGWIGSGMHERFVEWVNIDFVIHIKPEFGRGVLNTAGRPNQLEKRHVCSVKADGLFKTSSQKRWTRSKQVLFKSLESIERSLEYVTLVQKRTENGDVFLNTIEPSLIKALPEKLESLGITDVSVTTSLTQRDRQEFRSGRYATLGWDDKPYVTASGNDGIFGVSIKVEFDTKTGNISEPELLVSVPRNTRDTSVQHALKSFLDLPTNLSLSDINVDADGKEA